MPARLGGLGGGSWAGRGVRGPFWVHAALAGSSAQLRGWAGRCWLLLPSSRHIRATGPPSRESSIRVAQAEDLDLSQVTGVP